MHNSTRLDYARFYIEKLGFGLCIFDTGTKGPKTSGWNTPRLYIDTIEKAENELIRRPNSSMGVIHEASNTVCIDVDHLEWFVAAMQEFGINADETIKQGIRISSGRANRAKAVYKKPAALLECRNKSLSWPDPDTGALTTVFELRGGPVQDVLPPSIHPDTQKPYVWLDDPSSIDELPELPEIITQIWLNWEKIKPQLQDACPWKRASSTPTPPAPQRNSDGFGLKVISAFNDAHDLGAMLEAYGYQKRGKRYLAPASSTKLAGVILFDDGNHFYSHHASDVFGDGKRHDAFDIFMQFECENSITLAIQKAKNLLGMNAPEIEFNIDISALKKPEKAAKKNTSIPAHLLSPPGILKSIVDQIVSTARMPQPVYAVNAALSLVATLAARKVQNETGLRTNFYLVSLGPTGSGKEHARNYMKNALHSLGKDTQLGGEDIASGQGLMARAAMSPNAVFQIDELGKFLCEATDKNSASHKVSVLTNLMKLFSSSSSVVTGTEYANQKMNERQTIEYPCINVHGTSTDSTFYDSLKGVHILDGFVNRLLVTQTDDPRPPKQRIQPVTKPDQVIIDWFKRFENHISNGAGLLGIQPEAPYVVKMTKSAWDLFDRLDAEIDKRMEETRGTGLDSLYVRVWEHAAKVALICGCAKDAPHIEKEDAQWAIDFVMYWNERLVSEAKLRIADSEFGSLMNLILQQLKKNQDGLTKGRLFHHKKLREVQPFVREQLITALIENGEVTVDQSPSTKAGGRPSMTYKAAENV